jgi:dihydroflavonol-4-reductase
VPHLLFHIVDVRDVAAAHVKALTTPGAANQRYICSAVEESVPFAVISATLHDEFAPLGYVFQCV